MQIERLVQMVFAIVDRGHVTARELADSFGVSTRTIYRDINALTLAGIPIVSAKGTGGGISLLEGYAIDKAYLSEQEQQNILQGLQILQASQYPNAGAALRKVGAVFQNALEPKWLEVDFSYWGSEEKQRVSISELQYAILNKHAISFGYCNSELEKSQRILEPMRLVFKSHAWYIVGYCRGKGDIRIFRLSRMRDIKILPEVFTRELPKGYSVTPKGGAAAGTPVFKLKCSPEIAVRLYDEFREDEVMRCEDGSYMVTVQYPLSNWTLNRLLGYGQYVEVLEPKEARTMLRQRALEIACLYDGGA